MAKLSITQVFYMFLIAWTAPSSYDKIGYGQQCNCHGSSKSHRSASFWRFWFLPRGLLKCCKMLHSQTFFPSWVHEQDARLSQIMLWRRKPATLSPRLETRTLQVLTSTADCALRCFGHESVKNLLPQCRQESPRQKTGSLPSSAVQLPDFCGWFGAGCLNAIKSFVR